MRLCVQMHTKGKARPKPSLFQIVWPTQSYEIQKCIGVVTVTIRWWMCTIVCDCIHCTRLAACAVVCTWNGWYLHQALVGFGLHHWAQLPKGCSWTQLLPRSVVSSMATHICWSWACHKVCSHWHQFHLNRFCLKWFEHSKWNRSHLN